MPAPAAAVPAGRNSPRELPSLAVGSAAQRGVSLLRNMGRTSWSCFKTVALVPAVCSGAGLVSGAGIWQVPESRCHLLGYSLGLCMALPRLELLGASTTLQSCVALEARRDGAWGRSIPEQSLAVWRDA